MRSLKCDKRKIGVLFLRNLLHKLAAAGIGTQVPVYWLLLQHSRSAQLPVEQHENRAIFREMDYFLDYYTRLANFLEFESPALSAAQKAGIFRELTAIQSHITHLLYLCQR